MKQAKRDISLNEKDALQDMLNVEKQLLTYYGTALIEGSSKAFRKEIQKNCNSCSENQFSIFEQMLTRGYYEVMPAEKMMIDKKVETFSKVNKQLSAG